MFLDSSINQTGVFIALNLYTASFSNALLNMLRLTRNSKSLTSSGERNLLSIEIVGFEDFSVRLKWQKYVFSLRHYVGTNLSTRIRLVEMVFSTTRALRTSRALYLSNVCLNDEGNAEKLQRLSCLRDPIKNRSDFYLLALTNISILNYRTRWRF